MNLSDFDLYAFFCADGIGNRKINRMLKSSYDKFEGVEKFLTKTPDELPEVLEGFNKKDLESLRSLDIETVKAEYDLMLSSGIDVITANSERYPHMLRKRLGPDAPAILFSWGKHDIILTPAVAVVGSRHVSDQGEEFAARLVERMKDIPVSIISGGARGIDAAAHKSALKYGLETVVVLAQGINGVVGRGEDVTVLNNILFLSQFHPNSGWSPGGAMIRNKTVCALASAIFVVEAVKSGGTVNAGETALKMGVPLYVVSPDEYKIPPPGNRYLISRGGRELFLDSVQESFVDLGC